MSEKDPKDPNAFIEGDEPKLNAPGGQDEHLEEPIMQNDPTVPQDLKDLLRKAADPKRIALDVEGAWKRFVTENNLEEKNPPPKPDLKKLN